MGQHKTHVNWGVLGGARIARMQFLPALLRCDNARFAAFASRDRAKFVEFQALFGDFDAHASYESLLEDAAIDAVYIPLPNSLHCAWAKKAMQKGKHVLCEKPLALTFAEAESMAKTAKECGVLLMEAFMYRYTDRTQQIENVVKSGVLGEIKAINSSFRFFLDRENTIKEKPELGGGALYDIGVYPLNFTGRVLALSKLEKRDVEPISEPLSISVECEKKNGVDVNFSAILRYENGVLATLQCGFNAFGAMHSEIIGTEGVLVAPDTFLDEAGELILQTKDGTKRIPVAQSDRYAEEIRDFSAAILENRAPKLSLDESLNNMRILDRLMAAIHGRDAV